MKQLHLTIHGNVQGVFFREKTKEKADELRLFGYVRNISDGTVEVVVHGDEQSLKKLLEWCRIGPRLAMVERVDEVWKDIGKTEFSEFKII